MLRLRIICHLLYLINYLLLDRGPRCIWVYSLSFNALLVDIYWWSRCLLNKYLPVLLRRHGCWLIFWAARILLLLFIWLRFLDRKYSILFRGTLPGLNHSCLLLLLLIIAFIIFWLFIVWVAFWAIWIAIICVRLLICPFFIQWLSLFKLLCLLLLGHLLTVIIIFV